MTDTYEGWKPSINWNPEDRLIEPKGIIVHAMAYEINGMPAWEFLESIGLSAHAFIPPEPINVRDREYNVVLGQDDNKKAYHAGLSKHNDLTKLNNHYLGVEFLIDISNWEELLARMEIRDTYTQFKTLIRQVDWVTSSQMDAGVAWCKEMMKTYNIPIENIVYHSDVSGDDVRGDGKGKIDPEKMFPEYEFFKHLGYEEYYMNYRLPKRKLRGK